MARACAQGKLLACGCGQVDFKATGTKIPANAILEGPPGAPPTADYHWKWGGCSHNMEYGIAFSKTYLDSREVAGDLHSRVNLHNNDIGRRVSSSYFFCDEKGSASVPRGIIKGSRTSDNWLH